MSTDGEHRRIQNADLLLAKQARQLVGPLLEEVSTYQARVAHYTGIMNSGRYAVGPDTDAARAVTALTLLIADLGFRLDQMVGIASPQVAHHSRVVDAERAVRRAAVSAEEIRQIFTGEHLRH